MEKFELAKENHLFLVTQVPKVMSGNNFSGVLGTAYDLMKDIRNKGRKPCSKDFRECSFQNGYVGISAPAAEIIKNYTIDTFKIATALSHAFSQDADVNEMNEMIQISVDNHKFIFMITDYEINDPHRGWINVTDDPLSVSSDQAMHRRVIICLA